MHRREMQRTIRMASLAAGLVILDPGAITLMAQTAPAPASESATAQAGAASHTFHRKLPVYATTEGQPIDSRPPEKADDQPLFAHQTRAPFHATAPYKIPVITNTLHAP